MFRRPRETPTTTNSRRERGQRLFRGVPSTLPGQHLSFTLRVYECLTVLFVECSRLEDVRARARRPVEEDVHGYKGFDEDNVDALQGLIHRLPLDRVELGSRSRRQSVEFCKVGHSHQTLS